MKQVNLTITFDEEKLSALKRYMQLLTMGGIQTILRNPAVCQLIQRLVQPQQKSGVLLIDGVLDIGGMQ